MSTVATKRHESGLMPNAGVITGEEDWINKRTSNLCANCGGQHAKCKRREFSLQAYTVLLLWQEMSPSAVDQPICNECYNELRDVLIDRSDEIELVTKKEDASIQAIRQKVNSLAS